MVDTNGLPIQLAVTPTRISLSGSSCLASGLGQYCLSTVAATPTWIRELAIREGAWAKIRPNSNRNKPIYF